MAHQRLNLQLNLPQDYPGFIHTVQQLSGNTSAPANIHDSDQMDSNIGSISAINPVLASLDESPGLIKINNNKKWEVKQILDS